MSRLALSVAWSTAPRFDELHVISDLHFGGDKPAAQIFGSTPELVALIDGLASVDPARSVALVINGDFIDFLAEKPSDYFDVDGALTKLERVLGDATFAPVFAALTRFLSIAQRTLIINLGNHDLELALPWVRARLVSALCADGGAEAERRLSLVLDGTGVACSVGAARVLVAHGNEVDSWNVADYERIRRIARDTQFGFDVQRWIPNAGTRMVIDVMNGIKRRFPFVDLLKPEVEAVIPTLLSLEPALALELAGIARPLARKTVDAVRRGIGFLGGQAVEDDASSGPFSAPALPGVSVADRRAALQASRQQLMAFVEQELDKGTQPLDLLQAPVDAQLGGLGAVWRMIRGRPAHESLREMLEKLDQDRSFDTDVEDDTSRDMDALVAPDVDFVIAGHTHLERALPRKAGGHYYNSGTWARLIQIPAEVRQDPQKFATLFEVLRGGTMDRLDAEPGLVTKRCSVVSIVRSESGSVVGQLRRVRCTNGKLSLDAVPNTRFEKD